MYTDSYNLVVVTTACKMQKMLKEEEIVEMGIALEKLSRLLLSGLKAGQATLSCLQLADRLVWPETGSGSSVDVIGL